MNDKVELKYVAIGIAIIVFFTAGITGGIKESEVSDTINFDDSISTLRTDDCYGEDGVNSFRGFIECVDSNATEDLDRAESTIAEALDELDSGNRESALETLESYN